MISVRIIIWVFIGLVVSPTRKQSTWCSRAFEKNIDDAQTDSPSQLSGEHSSWQTADDTQSQRGCVIQGCLCALSFSTKSEKDFDTSFDPVCFRLNTRGFFDEVKSKVGVEFKPATLIMKLMTKRRCPKLVRNYDDC